MHDVDPGEVDAWLRLVTTPRVGRAAARRLLAAFGSAEAICCRQSGGPGRAVAGESLGSAAAPASVPRRPRRAPSTGWLPRLRAHPAALILLGDRSLPRPPAGSGRPAPAAARRRPARPAPGVRRRHGGQPPRQHRRAGPCHRLRRPAGRGWPHHRVGARRGVDGAAHEGALPHAAQHRRGGGTGLDQVYPRPHARPLPNASATPG